MARSKNKGNRYDRVLTIGIIITLIVIALTLWGPLGRFIQPREEAPQQAKNIDRPSGTQTAPDLRDKAQSRKDRMKKPGKSPAGSVGTSALIAIVIDDLGQDLKPARELLALPVELTFAVMPGLPHSVSVANLAGKGGREVLLHMPMEQRSRSGKKPAPGTLRAEMTPPDFLAAIDSNIASVPGAVGVNNHEGSLLSENAEAMKFLMAELKARDLFFLDSRTSPRSVAYSTAREFGMRAIQRDVFLDSGTADEAAIRKQLEELRRIALERGRAVGIGHPHPATIRALRTWLASDSAKGIEVVPLSKTVK